jgi:hypothetical protein
MALPKKNAAPKPRVSALAAAVRDADAAGSREPLFDPGQTEAAFVSLRENPPVAGKDPWVKALFECDDGVQRAVLFCVSPRSLSSSAPRIKSLAMALVGTDDVDAYTDWDPAGEFVDALLGIENEKSSVVEQYVGKRVIVCTSRGSDTRDGSDFFRNTTFKMIEEAE